MRARTASWYETRNQVPKNNGGWLGKSSQRTLCC